MRVKHVIFNMFEYKAINCGNNKKSYHKPKIRTSSIEIERTLFKFVDNKRIN